MAPSDEQADWLKPRTFHAGSDWDKHHHKAFLKRLRIEEHRSERGKCTGRSSRHANESGSAAQHPCVASRAPQLELCTADQSRRQHSCGAAAWAAGLRRWPCGTVLLACALFYFVAELGRPGGNFNEYGSEGPGLDDSDMSNVDIQDDDQDDAWAPYDFPPDEDFDFGPPLSDYDSTSSGDDADGDLGHEPCEGVRVAAYDYGLSQEQLRHWRDAEKQAGVRLRAAQPPRNKGAAQHLTDEWTQAFAAGDWFVPAKRFHEKMEGYAFAKGEHGLGYYRQTCSDVLTPGTPAANLPNGETSVTSELRITRRRKRKKQSRQRIANRSGPVQFFPPVTGIADAQWRQSGLWAIDTANTNCLNTAEDKVLGRSSADIVLLQETKVNEKQAAEAAKQRLMNLGWRAHLGLATTTNAGAPSSGTAVLNRRANGLAPVEEELAGGEQSHRIAAAWVDGVLKGGILCISVYLKDGVGLNDSNTKVLDEVLVTAKAAGLPFIIAGDWNVQPEDLERAGWLETLKAVAICPQQPTCNDNRYDFFVVDNTIRHIVTAVQIIDDGGMKPHKPVRLLLAGNGRRYAVNKLKRPVKVPGCLPQGPAMTPPSYSEVLSAASDEQALTAALSKWYQLARSEFAHLMGKDAAHRPTTFAWEPAAGTHTAAWAGQAKRGRLWRISARRAQETAAKLKIKPCDRTASDLAIIQRNTLQTQRLRTPLDGDASDADVDKAPTDSADADERGSWVDAFGAAAANSNHAWMTKLAKTADDKGKKVETKVRSERAKHWRQIIGGRVHDQPKKAAYRWIKGGSAPPAVPLVSPTSNDDVPEADAAACGPRIIQFNGSSSKIPAAQQTMVDMEAEKWAKLWQEGQAYHVNIPDEECKFSNEVLADAIVAAAQSFPADTGVGMDNIAPRAIARLSDDAIQALAHLLTQLEKLGSWTSVLDLVLIVLLPKADGGLRPIGLLPTVIRVWSRARAVISRAWEAETAHPSLYGSAGMGAQRAAWLEAFRAEAACLAQEEHAQALLDLSKAFETVRHDILIDAARASGFPMGLLRMSLASYRLKRVVGVDGTYSRTIQATRGITAGSTFASTELRLLLNRMVKESVNYWAGRVMMTLYVDDLTISVRDAAGNAARTLAVAVDHAVKVLQVDLQMTVNTVKSKVVASKPSLAVKYAAATTSKAITPARWSKLLGTPAAGGARRNVMVTKKRISKIAKLVPRMQALRAKGVKTATMARAAGTSAIAYGVEIMGMAPSTLSTARATIARACTGAAGGKNSLAVLYTQDAKDGTIDPAFDAFSLPVKHWAMAWWENWAPCASLADAYDDVRSKFAKSKMSWQKVTGPVSTLFRTLEAAGWDWLSAAIMRDDTGRE